MATTPGSRRRETRTDITGERPQHPVPMQRPSAAWTRPARRTSDINEVNLGRAKPRAGRAISAPPTPRADRHAGPQRPQLHRDLRDRRGGAGGGLPARPLFGQQPQRRRHRRHDAGPGRRDRHQVAIRPAAHGATQRRRAPGDAAAARRAAPPRHLPIRKQSGHVRLQPRTAGEPGRGGGDHLVTTIFAGSTTLGFSSPATGVAVCLKPGTELAFPSGPFCGPVPPPGPAVCDCTLPPCERGQSAVHHDALEFAMVRSCSDASAASQEAAIRSSQRPALNGGTRRSDCDDRRGHAVLLVSWERSTGARGFSEPGTAGAQS